MQIGEKNPETSLSQKECFEILAEAEVTPQNRYCYSKHGYCYPKNSYCYFRNGYCYSKSLLLLQCTPVILTWPNLGQNFQKYLNHWILGNILIMPKLTNPSHQGYNRSQGAHHENLENLCNKIQLIKRYDIHPIHNCVSMMSFLHRGGG